MHKRWKYSNFNRRKQVELAGISIIHRTGLRYQYLVGECLKSNIKIKIGNFTDKKLIDPESFLSAYVKLVYWVKIGNFSDKTTHP